MRQDIKVNKEKFDSLLQKLIQAKPTSKKEISQRLRATKIVQKTDK